MQLTLAQVVAATGAIPSNVDLDQIVTGWSIDSRTLNPGDLFLAIKGDIHDGHAFLPAAIERGAVAALVQTKVDGPSLLVPDTLVALQKLASYARHHWGRDVVCVTGSAGKTSTKDIVAELLGGHFRIGKTIGNFNNHIGLPLSILRIPNESEIAVLELGMNHAGEIRALASIANPRVGVVTNVGYAHVEFFESIDGIAAAKRELIEALPIDGIAVLNADDERVSCFTFAGRTIRYGFSDTADIRAELTANGFAVNGVEFETELPGRHSISNILAGIAVATVAYGIPLADLAAPVAALRPAKMRGERTVRNGIIILNDSYNSNPEAARHMIDCLQAEPAKRRIAVLGEMLELGHMAEPLHRQLGAYAANAGVDLVIGIAGASKFLVEEAAHTQAAHFFPDAESAGNFLKQIVHAGDAILFKGSRGTHVERALATMED
jgi:UDP-N-acetylmuramoyl-tripeptide--D-alanyl-D-alanine ligase